MLPAPSGASIVVAAASSSASCAVASSASSPVLLVASALLKCNLIVGASPHLLERYEGTQTPKDFSSEIRLVNEGDGIDRELRIWMNNPLRYARRTFYQSGYLPDDGGTVLQVVRNDSWMIPYLSCMIVFIGMVAQFGLSLKRMRKRELS